MAGDSKKSKDKEKDKDRDRERSKDKERDREKSHKDRKSDRSDRTKDKKKERDRERSRERDRSHEKSRKRSPSRDRDRRDKSRDRRDRDRKRSRERRRSRSYEDRKRKSSRSPSPDRKKRRDVPEEPKETKVTNALALAAEISQRALQREKEAQAAKTQATSILQPVGLQAQVAPVSHLDIIQKLNAAKPTAAAPAAVVFEEDPEVIAMKRAERARLWQEEKKRQELQNAAQQAINKTSLYGLMGKKWNLEDEGDDDDSVVQPSPVASVVGRSESKESSVKVNSGQFDDDVDPLDAFMVSFTANEPVVAQDPMSGAFGAGDTRRKVEAFNPYGTNTITLEDIIAGKASENNDWESESETEDDEKEEREKQEFLQALKKKLEPTPEPLPDVKMEDVNEPPAAEDNGKRKVERIFGEEGDIFDEDEFEQKEKSALEVYQDQQKKKELKQVDHSKIEYIKIRKNLFVVPKVLASMSEKEVATLREELEIKVRGKGCPPPIASWDQCGLSDRILKLLEKNEMHAPFAIQKQAIPAIMSGRDIIGVAKTGSGKTLAFLLPLLRHILDQPPLKEGEGPIGLIMAPARELAVQIWKEASKFCKHLKIRCAAVYGGAGGGAGVANQIADLKRGAEIVVCTPGRMIDILTMQAGKLVSLQRVSYVVMDEADRMFDMGFAPQIQMIIQNVRPDRQTVLFSATFPKPVEALARKVLKFPLEIIVGGRSIVSDTIEQMVEIHEEDDKFYRLLQLLGVWYEKGNVLVFVDTQKKCDDLFMALTKQGYGCLSLHGGKDQQDRDDTIQDFKKRIKTLMVATSVAGRGLDVPELICVINYSAPDHYEDYVHRVGRTGRAGRQGTSYTFITPEEEQLSEYLVKALEVAKKEVPVELKELNASYKEKLAKGEAKKAKFGFGGHGYTFTENEVDERGKMKIQYEIEQGLRDTGDKDDEAVFEEEEGEEGAPAPGATGAAGVGALPQVPQTAEAAKGLQDFMRLASKFGISVDKSGGKKGEDEKKFYQEELEINDWPKQARWKVTHRDTIAQVQEMTGCAIISRGTYVNPGQAPPEGERKLHLIIEGDTAISVQAGRKELERILTEEAFRVGPSKNIGKYTVS